MGCPVCGEKLDFDFRLRVKQCYHCGWKMKTKANSHAKPFASDVPNIKSALSQRWRLSIESQIDK